MALSTNVEKAKEIATKAHAGAVDKAGAPYIEHPARVASRMNDDACRVVAWLHDVVEDTNITISMIEDLFGADTADALDHITHRKEEPWADYLVRVKAHPIARMVKIADLIDNSNLSRLPIVTAKDIARQAKYNRALYFLTDADGV